MRWASGQRVAEILVIEDNPGDVRLIREAFEETSLPHRLRFALDGVDALDTLRLARDGTSAPWPDLILLDLNLPRLDGRGVLRELRADPTFGHVPVVVLTSSSDERDVAETYAAGASCYVVKPVGLDSFLNAITAIAFFWLTIAQLPSRIGATA